MKTKDFYKKFGICLKELRLHANLSQEELAEIIGVSTKTVSYWENAHNPVTLRKLPLIAKIYKLFLFLDIDEKEADKDYIELLQSKTGKELDILFKIIKEPKKLNNLAFYSFIVLFSRYI